MDLTSIIGVVIGVVLIVFVGIGPKDLGNFWDPASVAIVLGGTLASVVASYPFSVLKATAKHIKILFQGDVYKRQPLKREKRRGNRRGSAPHMKNIGRC